jgi:hypothetical protein
MSTTRTARTRRQDVPANLAVDIPIVDTIPEGAVAVSTPIGGDGASPTDILQLS